MKKLFVVTFMCFFISSVTGQIPKLLSYQGLLTDTNGQILTDGNYNVTVKIFDAQTGGNELWSEDHSIALVSGLFNLALGSNAALDLAFNQPYFISTTINGEELLPRTALTASPYAFNALTSEAPRLRSITISPGMLNDAQLYGGASQGSIGGFNYPSIDLADGTFQEFVFQIPLPSDSSSFRLF